MAASTGLSPLPLPFASSTFALLQIGAVIAGASVREREGGRQRETDRQLQLASAIFQAAYLTLIIASHLS